MLKKYREDMVLRTCQCDMNGAWRPGAMMETMQEVAGQHSELLGVGRNALQEKGMAWVLTRLEIEMDRYPVIGERISVETYPTPLKRWFFPRCFILRDGAEREIGRAATLWVLLDLTARRMARPDLVAGYLPDNSDLPCPLGLPAPVTEISGTIEQQRFPVQYTDLDANHHVNNTRYMDWCCNALGIETLQQQELAHFSLNFNTEVLPGQQVRAELHRMDSAFSYSGFVGDTRAFDIGGTLRERKR